MTLFQKLQILQAQYMLTETAFNTTNRILDLIIADANSKDQLNDAMLQTQKEESEKMTKLAVEIVDLIKQIKDQDQEPKTPNL